MSFGVSQAETTGRAPPAPARARPNSRSSRSRNTWTSASVPLYNALVAGAHFPTVMLANRKAGGSQLIYLQYTFRQVFVTVISWSGGGGEEAPKETIKFKFGAMGIQYVQAETGRQRGYHDPRRCGAPPSISPPWTCPWACRGAIRNGWTFRSLRKPRHKALQRKRMAGSLPETGASVPGW